MGRALLILTDEFTRARAKRWIDKAPLNTRVEFKASKRTLPQNDRMHAMLTDIATTLDWHGQKYSPDDWKDYFMHSLRRARWMPDEEGGMVPLGMHTSDLSVEEMSDLMELMAAFGASHGVIFNEPKQIEAA